MAKLHEIDPTLDPLVIAAMLDDDEPEVDENPSDDKSSQADDDNSDTADEEAHEEETPTEQPDSEDNEVDATEPEKDEEADEDTTTEEEDPDKPLTRKQKREAKRKRYLESIRREGEQTSQRRTDLFQADPGYKPLDYNDVEELDVKDLQSDREQYGRTNFSKGAETERFYADQEKFWTTVEYEDKLLQTDPKYSFLNERSKKFDPDLAEDMHEKFLELVGFNPNTKTTRRTDVSFGNFVKREVEEREKWAARVEDQIVKNAAAQRSTAGIRPSGSATRSLGKLRPGDISKMSQKEFEKHEAEIDRQILAELGQ